MVRLARIALLTATALVLALATGITSFGEEVEPVSAQEALDCPEGDSVVTYESEYGGAASEVDGDTEDGETRREAIDYVLNTVSSEVDASLFERGEAIGSVQQFTYEEGGDLLSVANVLEVEGAHIVPTLHGCDSVMPG